jgi:hypothetical protein
MANPQATFTIDVPYQGQDGSVKYQQCSLTFSLSVSMISSEVSVLGGQQLLGEIGVQGPAMPVPDPRDGVMYTKQMNAYSGPMPVPDPREGAAAPANAEQTVSKAA